MKQVNEARFPVSQSGKVVGLDCISLKHAMTDSNQLHLLKYCFQI